MGWVHEGRQPRIALDLVGDLAAWNKAAEASLPGLVALGLEHPLLESVPDHLPEAGEAAPEPASWLTYHRGAAVEIRLWVAPEEGRVRLELVPGGP